MVGTGRMIVNPGPSDHPLRKWAVGDDDAYMNLNLIVGSMHALPALSRIHRDEPLDDRDLALLGMINFQAYLMTYEPIVALLPQVVRLHPAVVQLVPEVAHGASGS
ncbi:hypothetical protein ABRP09_00410 (plasmid) [Clavibacter michiganensis]|uniref:hypothetical protein n=2 Tax=Clavibacter michiganensis TaxID=28447 RepID=UPI00292E1609|nr:hypothetical protein [Clavibacter michiganensis]